MSGFEILSGVLVWAGTAIYYNNEPNHVAHSIGATCVLMALLLAIWGKK